MEESFYSPSARQAPPLFSLEDFSYLLQPSVALLANVLVPPLQNHLFMLSLFYQIPPPRGAYAPIFPFLAFSPFFFPAKFFLSG